MDYAEPGRAAATCRVACDEDFIRESAAAIGRPSGVTSRARDRGDVRFARAPYLLLQSSGSLDSRHANSATIAGDTSRLMIHP